MTIVVHYTPVPSSTTEQYDEVIRRLTDSGELPADGFDYHVAFLAEDQLCVTEVWDSQEQFEAFGQRIMPLLSDVALEHSRMPAIYEHPRRGATSRRLGQRSRQRVVAARVPSARPGPEGLLLRSRYSGLLVVLPYSKGGIMIE